MGLPACASREHAAFTGQGRGTKPRLIEQLASEASTIKAAVYAVGDLTGYDDSVYSAITAARVGLHLDRIVLPPWFS